MTNKEALVAVIRVNIPETSLEKSMLDRDIIPGDGYTKDNAEAIDLCAIELLAGLLAEPDVSEGGFSVKYDRSAVKERLLMLAKKRNATDILDQFRPSVTSRDVW